MTYSKSPKVSNPKRSAPVIQAIKKPTITGMGILRNSVKKVPVTMGNPKLIKQHNKN
jgi:hypothetical protein